MLNSDFPATECLARADFFRQGDPAFADQFEKVVVFGVAAVPGRALGFHVLTDWGAVWWRLPIHALCHSPDAPRRPLHELQVWNCFGAKVSVHEFDLLAECRVEAKVGDEHLPGQYLTTIDWHGSDYADGAGAFGHKAAHVVELDEGNFAALPGNFIRWRNKAWTSGEPPESPWLLNREVWSAELDGLSDDSEEWSYEITKTPNPQT